MTQVALVMVYVGDTIDVPVEGAPDRTMTVSKIAYSTPAPGKITLTADDGSQTTLSASQRVHLHRKDPTL